MKQIRNVFLVGTGAVGRLYRGKLSQTGVRVASLCRSDYDVVKGERDFRFLLPERVIRISF